MAKYPNQNASGVGIAQAFGKHATATVHYGIQTEELASLLQAAGATAQARVDELALQLKVTREAVLGFLRILDEDELPAEQLGAKLALIARRHVSQMDRLAMFDSEDPEVQDYIEKARLVLGHASSSAEYERVEELLCNAEQSQDRRLQQIETLALEANEAAQRLRLSKAATRAERGELSLIRLDYLSSAKHFRSASEILSQDIDPNYSLQYLFMAGVALRNHGDEKGDNLTLEESIKVFKLVISEYSRVGKPQNWATIQNYYLNTLQTLGERQSSGKHLEEAASENRIAASEYDRAKHGLEWLTFQNNCANALLTLSEREPKPDRLAEAIALYTELSELHICKNDPLLHAMVRNNLAVSLQVSGERRGDVRLLHDAINTCRQALAVYEPQRECVPLDWAMVQNNLGNAHLSLGMLEHKRSILKIAIAAYNKAREEYRKERTPLHWAGTTNNIGTALLHLAVIEGTPKRLFLARDCYVEALEINKREQGPLDWAMMKNNVGVVLRILSQLQGSISLLDTAISTYREALEEYRPEIALPQYEATQFNLSLALDLRPSVVRKGIGAMRLQERTTAHWYALKGVVQRFDLAPTIPLHKT